MKFFKSLLITLITFILLGSLSATEKSAKVIILRGKVKAKMGAKIINLKKGMWITEGALIQTAPRSFCKLLFIDKSQISLGPNSKMQIQTFPKKKPGIINLLKGQLRSKVTKNYMEMKKHNKSKLFIRTKTAAMGVRGTDFQVNFNPTNMVTSLITFEGAVAMAKVDETVNQINQQVLEKIVSSQDAVIVTKGEYSGVDQAAPRVTAPVKINPAQLETLKRSTDNTRQLEHTTTAIKPKKQFRNPIPPGVNAKVLASKMTAEKVVAKTIGEDIVKQVKQQVIAQEHPEPKWAEKRLEQRPDTSHGPRAGGYIDLKTALYIPPPKNSVFDANIGMHVIPTQLGTIDPRTGDYIPPAGYKLTNNGELIVDKGRIPASIHNPQAEHLAKIRRPLMKIGMPAQQLDSEFTPPPALAEDGSLLPTEENLSIEDVEEKNQELIEDSLTESTWDYENAPPPIDSDAFTNVHIIIE